MANRFVFISTWPLSMIRAPNSSVRKIFGIQVWLTRFAVPDLWNSSIKINDAK